MKEKKMCAFLSAFANYIFLLLFRGIFCYHPFVCVHTNWLLATTANKQSTADNEMLMIHFCDGNARSWIDDDALSSVLLWWRRRNKEKRAKQKKTNSKKWREHLHLCIRRRQLLIVEFKWLNYRINFNRFNFAESARESSVFTDFQRKIMCRHTKFKLMNSCKDLTLKTKVAAEKNMKLFVSMLSEQIE